MIGPHHFTTSQSLCIMIEPRYITGQVSPPLWLIQESFLSYIDYWLYILLKKKEEILHIYKIKIYQARKSTFGKAHKNNL